MSPDHIQDLRQDLQKFRSKIENGTIVKRISAYIVYSFIRLFVSFTGRGIFKLIQFTYSYYILNPKLSSPLDASNEVSPAHRKLKYRRLSDAKHKEVREKFMKIWYAKCHLLFYSLYVPTRMYVHSSNLEE